MSVISYDDAVTLYRYLRNAAQLALLYPVILTQCSFSAIQRSLIYSSGPAHSASGVYSFATNVNASLAYGAYYGLKTTIIVNNGSSYEMTDIQGCSWNEKENIASADQWGATGLFKEFFDNRSQNQVTNLTVFSSLNKGISLAVPDYHVGDASFNSYIRMGLSIMNMMLHILARSNTTFETSYIPFISNSLHFPSYNFRVCTDAENISKFSGFMTGVAVLAGVVIGGIVVGQVVKAISNYKVTTNALYFNNLQKIAATPQSSPEYERLLKEGRKLRRRMKRIGDISASTGAGVTSLSMDLSDSSDKISRIVKLIQG